MDKHNTKSSQELLKSRLDLKLNLQLQLASPIKNPSPPSPNPSLYFSVLDFTICILILKIWHST